MLIGAGDPELDVTESATLTLVKVLLQAPLYPAGTQRTIDKTLIDLVIKKDLSQVLSWAEANQILQVTKAEMGIGASDGSFYPASFWSLLESPWIMVGPLVQLESLLMNSMGAKDGSNMNKKTVEKTQLIFSIFASFSFIKILPLFLLGFHSHTFCHRKTQIIINCRGDVTDQF